MAAQDVTDATFQQLVHDERAHHVLVDYWAEWCGPCRMMAPVVDTISDKYADTLKVYKLDTDANPESAQAAQIVSIPCLILYKDGQEVTRFTGFRPQDALEAELNKHLG